jgi:hypothetical protein
MLMLVCAAGEAVVLGDMILGGAGRLLFCLEDLSLEPIFGGWCVLSYGPFSPGTFGAMDLS